MSGGDPLISVVVPTKGRPRYLRGCLAALASSNYPRDRFEVVIVNDGGGVEVERVADRFAGPLRVTLTAPERTGPSAARNAGAATSSARNVAFTDDDCVPTPSWLRELERALESNPGAAIGGQTRNGATGSPAAAASQIVVDAVHAHFNRDPGAPRFFASYNVAFPAEPFLAVGGFDERFRYAEDREMCERWIGAGHRFVHAPAALVYHMRTLTLREFLGQHYGYGRGASAFHRARASEARPDSDRTGVLRALARATLRANGEAGRGRVTGLVVLSQIAAAAGVGREALSRIGPGRSNGS